MRAGILTENITIKRPTVEKNAYGEEVVSYDTIWTTRARVVHTGGGRTVENESIFYNQTKTLEVRDYVPVDYYDIIEWDGRKYRVIDIEPFKAQQKTSIKIELIND
jgi:hypothetical protein